MPTLILHIAMKEPIKVDVDALPNPGDNVVVCKNPRLRSDKELDWLDEGVNEIIVPMHMLNYIQVYPDGEESLDFPLTYRD